MKSPSLERSRVIRSAGSAVDGQSSSRWRNAVAPPVWARHSRPPLAEHQGAAQRGAQGPARRHPQARCCVPPARRLVGTVVPRGHIGEADIACSVERGQHIAETVAVGRTHRREQPRPQGCHRRRAADDAVDATVMDDVAGERVSIAGNVRDTATRPLIVARHRLNSCPGLVSRHRKMLADAATGGALGVTQLVPHLFGDSPAALGDQSRPSTAHRMRCRRRVVGVLATIIACIRRAVVTGRDAVHYPAQRAQLEGAVHRVHRRRCPAILWRAPARRHRRVVTAVGGE